MTPENIKITIQTTIDINPVTLFMKGSTKTPRCGFSSKVVGVLDYMGVEFHDVDVLANDMLRQGIKDFSDWPTVPQLYVKGEFVGGCDIITEMVLSAEMDTLLASKEIAFDKDAAARIRESNKQDNG